MKLLTHNMLTSRCLKGVNVGYPLKLIAHETKQREVAFNSEFVQKMIPKMDWNVLASTAKQFGVDLPCEPPSNASEASEDLLRKVHHALLEIEIMQGELICPETGRKFPIKQGIPNMLCNEDEV
ncbi:hypothetical protein B4U79_02651 [Dinothrombium tinctorium]|uniref:Multifunctional methyltransferase subunit TRM112-like protein n=1 Tax=Dinothrombium tinctorium TaxID=1965070 RepID=A0A443QTE6_9ACAR|nr:hypothetical protein B4U79_02651 [Dinothrombium tinctorium]